MGLGMTELLIVAGIAILVFGPSRLPKVGGSLGQAIRDFKLGLNGRFSEDEGSSKIEVKPEQVTAKNVE